VRAQNRLRQPPFREAWSACCGWRRRPTRSRPRSCSARRITAARRDPADRRDRGLAGSYNSGVLRLTERTVPNTEPPVPRSRSGRWARRPAFLRFRGIEVAQSFVGVADRPEFSDARRIASIVAAPSIRRVDLVQMISTASSPPDPARRADADAAAALPKRRGGLRGGRDASGLHRVRAGPAKLLVKLAPRAWRRRSSPRCSRFGGVLHRATARHGGATENADELVRTLTAS